MPYLFVLLSIADWVITLALLNHGGYGEANPVTAWLMQGNLVIASIAKLGGTIVIAWLMIYSRSALSQFWSLMYNLGPLVIFILLVGWNLSLAVEII